MGARSDCKKAGLYGITDLGKRVGRSRPVIYTWYEKDHDLFLSALIGAVIIKECGTNDIDEIMKKVNVLKSIIKATEEGVKNGN